MKTLAALAFAVLVAHGGSAVQDSDYRPRVDGFSPDVDGISARLVDDDTRIELDAGDHEVVVLGYQGEPYLLVDEGGVFENLRSPSTYLNRSLDGDPIPPEADADADPDWERIGDGPRARWHDHALHVPPGQALGERDESEWSIPLRVDGEDVTLDGRMLTLPDTSAIPYIAGALVLATVVILSLRTTGTGVTMALLAALLALDLLRLYGIGFGTSTWLASRWEVIREQGTLPIVGWGMAIAALVLYARRRRFEALAATIVAAAVIAFGGGVLELDDLTASRIASALPDVVTRAVVAAVLGLGLGLAMRAVLEIRLATSRPARRARRSDSAPTPADDTRTASPSRPASD
jgi:hypothetical protein